MKITVYAISKNEAKFAARWAKSMSEADEIVVLDTGSDDDTVKILTDAGVHVESAVIEPWRFDSARNESLKLVPPDTDVCVCTDLDEVFEPGWRAALEKPGRTAQRRAGIDTSGRTRRTANPAWSFTPRKYILSAVFSG